MGLMVSKAVYMPPSPTRYDFDSFKNNLIWIPKTRIGMKHADPDMPYIPCLFTYVENARYLIIYCHGNAADLGTLYPEMAFMASTLNAHILCVEYPGYGLHKGDSNEDSLHATLMDVFYYVTAQMKFDPRYVILYGRSLGTAVCCRVAAELCRHNHPIGGLIMHSAFTSIKEVVEKMVRTAFFMGRMFDSTKYISQVTCPCLFIHGMKDSLVPYEHSKTLFDLCSSSRKRLLLFEDADHNRFKYYEEVLVPILHFLSGYCSDAFFGTVREEVRENPQRIKKIQRIWNSIHGTGPASDLSQGYTTNNTNNSDKTSNVTSTPVANNNNDDSDDSDVSYVDLLNFLKSPHSHTYSTSKQNMSQNRGFVFESDSPDPAYPSPQDDQGEELDELSRLKLEEENRLFLENGRIFVNNSELLSTGKDNDKEKEKNYASPYSIGSADSTTSTSTTSTTSKTSTSLFSSLSSNTKNTPTTKEQPKTAITYVGARDPTFINISPNLFRVPNAMRLFSMAIFERCTPVTIASNFVEIGPKIPQGPFRIDPALEAIFNKQPPENSTPEEKAEHFRVYSRKAVNIYMKSIP